MGGAGGSGTFAVPGFGAAPGAGAGDDAAVAASFRTDGGAAAGGFAGPPAFGGDTVCSLRAGSPFAAPGFGRWKTVRIPPPEPEPRLPAECTTAPAAARVLSVDIGRPHFGQFGNDPMQCWQSGAPHEWIAEAIPPQPTHRGAASDAPCAGDTVVAGATSGPAPSAGITESADSEGTFSGAK